MKEWQTDARFDGQAAFDALRNGMQIRRVMWTAGCSVVAVDDDGEFTIIPNRSTAILAFSAEKFDVTFPWELSIPLARDVKSSAPWAVCEITSTNVSTNLLVNSQKAPFDNAEVRRALALTIDRLTNGTVP